jgi:hypothetical protein
MPNWCYNSATLSHKNSKKIASLMKHLKGEDVALFQHLRKRPKDQEDNWYQWNVDNWGTKWDATISHYEQMDESTVFISFETAWCPPIALYDYLTEKKWSVQAKYHEPGVCLVGDYLDGDDQPIEYNDHIDDLEALKNLIPEDLFEYAGIEQIYEDYVEHLSEQEERENAK